MTDNTPKLIEDEALDQANGGILIGLLLPAVQKVREASTSGGLVKTGPGTLVLNADAVPGDGSV